MNFCVIINTNETMIIESCKKFIRACLDRDHKIPIIHFRNKAVIEANSIDNYWYDLIKNNGVKLGLCYSSCLDNGIKVDRIAEIFQISGMGELSESISSSDRIIQFN